jgi:hypothetical protein
MLSLTSCPDKSESESEDEELLLEPESDEDIFRCRVLLRSV